MRTSPEELHVRPWREDEWRGKGRQIDMRDSPTGGKNILQHPDPPTVIPPITWRIVPTN